MVTAVAARPPAVVVVATAQRSAAALEGHDRAAPARSSGGGRQRALAPAPDSSGVRRHCHRQHRLRRTDVGAGIAPVRGGPRAHDGRHGLVAGHERHRCFADATGACQAEGARPDGAARGWTHRPYRLYQHCAHGAAPYGRCGTDGDVPLGAQHRSVARQGRECRRRACPRRSTARCRRRPRHHRVLHQRIR